MLKFGSDYINKGMEAYEARYRRPFLETVCVSPGRKRTFYPETLPT